MYTYNYNIYIYNNTNIIINKHYCDNTTNVFKEKQRRSTYIEEKGRR